MSPETPTVRASRILGQAVHDRDGHFLGRVADLITETAPDGTERVVSAYVVKRPWGRLLGYERDESTGPRLLEALARRIMRRDATVVPFTDLPRPAGDVAR
jgi:sporulation protein YlmC with PRC-barrel domain